MKIINLVIFTIIFSFFVILVFADYDSPGIIISDINIPSYGSAAAMSSNGNVVVAWYQITSSNSSQTFADIIVRTFYSGQWSDPKNLTSNIQLPISSPYNDKAFLMPKLLVDDNVFYLFFVGGWTHGMAASFPLIYLSISYDGINFSEPSPIINSNQILLAQFSYAVYYDAKIINNNIYLIACLWDTKNTYTKIYLFESDGFNWSRSEEIPFSNQFAYIPSIEGFINNTFLAFIVINFNNYYSDVYYINNKEGIWGQFENISNDLAYSDYQKLFLKDNSNLFLFWIDYSNYEGYGSLVAKIKNLQTDSWSERINFTPETDLDYERPMEYTFFKDTKENMWIIYTSGMPMYPRMTSLYIKIFNTDKAISERIAIINGNENRDYNGLTFSSPVMLTNNDGYDLKFIWSENNYIKFYEYQLGGIPNIKAPENFRIAQEKDVYFITSAPVVNFYFTAPENSASVSYYYSIEKSIDGINFTEIKNGTYAEISAYVDADVVIGSNYFYRLRSYAMIKNAKIYSKYTDIASLIIINNI